MSTLSHLDDQGRARMVDVSAKAVTRREAVAACRIRLQPQTMELIRAAGLPKGDVLSVARVAGILAAKRTSELIPLCHPLLLEDVSVDLTLTEEGIDIRAVVVTTGKTGAEMEALTAVSVAALALYDMCKAVDEEMVIDRVRLVAKTGGKRDRREPAEPAP